MVNAEVIVSPPDGNTVRIKQLNIWESKEMLGVISCPAGDDSDYLYQKYMDRIDVWFNRMKNGHLPTKYA